MGSGSCRPYPLPDEATTVPAVQCVSEEPWLALGLQRQLLSRGCTAAQHKVIHSQSEGHALPCRLAASPQARPNHNRTRIAGSTRLSAWGRPAGQGSCKVKRSDFGPTGVLYSLIFSLSKERPRPATPSATAAAAAPMITQCRARERVHGKARSATNTLMCDTCLAQRDQRGEHE